MSVRDGWLRNDGDVAALGVSLTRLAPGFTGWRSLLPGEAMELPGFSIEEIEWMN